MRNIELDTAQQIVIRNALQCAYKMYDTDSRHCTTPAMQEAALAAREDVFKLINKQFTKIT